MIFGTSTTRGFVVRRQKESCILFCAASGKNHFGHGSLIHAAADDEICCITRGSRVLGKTNFTPLFGWLLLCCLRHFAAWHWWQ